MVNTDTAAVVNPAKKDAMIFTSEAIPREQALQQRCVQTQYQYHGTIGKQAKKLNPCLEDSLALSRAIKDKCTICTKMVRTISQLETTLIDWIETAPTSRT